MIKLKNKTNFFKYVVVALIFTFGIPYLFQVFNASDVTKIGFIIFGFDMILAIVQGFIAGKRDDVWWVLLIFPLMFLLTAKMFFMSVLSVVAFFFLAASLLTYGIFKN
ncbi:hypothetical protein ACWCL1_02005 [Ligilactobacillus sp. LYQ135]